jgi:hypothetical protein
MGIYLGYHVVLLIFISNNNIEQLLVVDHLKNLCGGERYLPRGDGNL